VFAGHVATTMGAPISQLIIGSNSNDILSRFLHSGTMKVGEVQPTLSPAMDIQISSNFERLLFELLGRDGSRVAELMLQFRAEGEYVLGSDVMALLHERWSGERVDDVQTKKIIASTWTNRGVLVDPHTAVGLGAAVMCRRAAEPVVCFATAHPAKFPDAVESATGIKPELPERLADLDERTEQFEVLPNDLATVRAAIDAALDGS